MSLSDRIQEARELLYGAELAGEPIAVAERYRAEGGDMEAVLCAIGVIFGAEEGEIAETEETAALVERLVERARSSRRAG